MLKDFSLKVTHVSLRLHWLLYESKILPPSFSQKASLFGTLDTWIVWRLSEGASHITDASSASSTGLYDIFSKSWNNAILLLFGIKKSILPKIVSTHGEVLASVNKSFFGHEIAITTMIADQQAASFGCGCLDMHGCKLTLGTGLFLDITTLESVVARLSRLNGFQF